MPDEEVAAIGVSVVFGISSGVESKGSFPSGEIFAVDVSIAVEIGSRVEGHIGGGGQHSELKQFIAQDRKIEIQLVTAGADPREP